MDHLAPLSEELVNEEDTKNNSKKGQRWRNWLKNQFPLLFNKKSDLKILLSVLGCPLSPVNVHPKQPLIDVESSVQYIIQHFAEATGCRKIEGVVRSMCVTGKVKMVTVEDLGSSGLATATAGIPKDGCFMVWQMVPNRWLMELVVMGHKVIAGSDGNVAWRHMPWLGAHVAKGGVRPLRRSLQGLDPVTVAAMFSPAQYIGEKQIANEDCFLLTVSADQTALAERSDGKADIIKHVMIGYFSQRSGLLVYLEDSHLTRIQSPGTHPTYWETTVDSRIDDYRMVDGVMIAHSGHSTASMTRFGDNVKVCPVITRMEETWTVDDVVFNVPGLTINCFIPPEEVRGDYPDEDPDWQSPNPHLHRC